MRKIIALVFIMSLVLSCKKSDPEPTNKGTGKVNYNGNVDLSVEARTDGGYVLQGNGQTGNNILSLSMIFPQKPTSGTYTPEKDNIRVIMDISNGTVTLRNDLLPKETITVSVNGNRLEASFKDAKFDLRGSIYTYSGTLSVD